MSRKKRRFEELEANAAKPKEKVNYRDPFQERVGNRVEEVGQKFQGQGRTRERVSPGKGWPQSTGYLWAMDTRRGSNLQGTADGITGLAARRKLRERYVGNRSLPGGRKF